jgi:hypothetical protein
VSSRLAARNQREAQKQKEQTLKVPENQDSPPKVNTHEKNKTTTPLKNNETRPSRRRI